jgi:hypothetical protein
LQYGTENCTDEEVWAIGVMKSLLTVPVLTLIFLVTSCASTEQYSAPANMTNYALITDGFTGSIWESKSQYVSVDRIDQKEVSPVREPIPPEVAHELSDVAGIELDNTIILAPGKRRLLVSACRRKFSLLKAMVWDPNFICARTVIPIDAEPDGRYGLEGDINIDEDYADVWIVNLRDQSLTVDKIRLQGLNTK